MMPQPVAFFARAIGFAVVLLAAPALAQTSDPAQIQSARAMMASSGADRGFDQLVPNFLDETRRLMIQTRPELDKPLGEVLLVLAPEFNKRREELLNQIAAFYARRFTKAELDQVTAFYLSDTGKKMVSLLPGVAAETRDLLDDWRRTLATDIMTRVRVEMKKKGIDM